ncbi:copia protein [Tanacetum coccineum]
MTILGTKWVFRNKLDENGIVSRNKARLVAQGYNQQEGIDFDKTYAPVARLESIRILLAYACALDFKLFQMDVKSAFLNGSINEEFKMSMMGELNFFLGLQIKQMEDGIFFNQSKYIKEMLKKFGLEESKPMKTPMSSDTKLTKDEECESVDSTKYRGMIGYDENGFQCGGYNVVRTRPSRIVARVWPYANYPQMLPTDFLAEINQNDPLSIRANGRNYNVRFTRVEISAGTDVFKYQLREED